MSSTDITLLLDRSNSIASIRDAVIAGVNRFIDDQAQLPGRARITLAQFDTAYEVVWDNIPIPEAVPLDHSSLVPRGSTALLDAIGEAIQGTTTRLAALHSKDKPAKVIIAVFTDGLENASRRFTHRCISDLIRHRRDDGWVFLFLGANQDAILEAARLGIDGDSAHTFQATPEGTTAALGKLSSTVGRLRSRRRAEAANERTSASDPATPLEGSQSPPRASGADSETPTA